MIRSTLFASGIALGLVAAAGAQQAPGQNPAQGPASAPVITVGGTPFATWADYLLSAEFQELELRCGAPGHDYERVDVVTGAPSDCAYSSTSPQPQYAPTVCYTIPVVVHVIQSTGGQGFISQSMVESQIDILNEDFRAISGTNGAPGTDAMIQFELASVDPSGGATNGITYSTNNTWFNDGGSYWNTLAWDTNRYLNIYTNLASGNLGYVPDIPQGGLVGSNSDRVVVLWSSFGRNAPIGAPFNQGRTTTHEVGHYLGLEHTFSGGCGTTSGCYSTGDLICDTARESSPTNGCPGNKTSCSSPDPVHNYMDYSDDLCMWEFSPEQANRMRCTLQNWRPNLYTTCIPGGGGGDDPIGLNIDVGANTTFPTPGSGYGAAAGQPGTWNAISSTVGGSLTGIDGSASGASVSVSGGNGDFSFNNAGTSGNAEDLLDDLQDAGTSTWTISGLVAATYDVYVYSFAPDDRTGFQSSITISGGSNGAQTCGGAAWTGSFVLGGQYITDRVTLTGGPLTINVAPTAGDTPTSVNGIQLVVVAGGGVGTASCFGVGCPCGNNDATAGCSNSTGSGALLSGSGSTSASADDLVLGATSVPTFNNGLFYMGNAQVSSPFFDGLQCALGTTFRFLSSIQSSGATGTLSYTGVGAASGGLITAGSTWHFHAWFRDVPFSVCGTGANLTNLLSVTFTP